MRSRPFVSSGCGHARPPGGAHGHAQHPILIRGAVWQETAASRASSSAWRTRCSSGRRSAPTRHAGVQHAADTPRCFAGCRVPRGTQDAARQVARTQRTLFSLPSCRNQMLPRPSAALFGCCSLCSLASSACTSTYTRSRAVLPPSRALPDAAAGRTGPAGLQMCVSVWLHAALCHGWRRTKTAGSTLAISRISPGSSGPSSGESAAAPRCSTARAPLECVRGYIRECANACV